MSINVLVFYGLPCTGKSTIIERILNKGIYEIIRIEEVWLRVSKHPVYSISESGHVFSTLIELLDDALERGKSVVIEGVFASKERIFLIRERVEIFKGKVLFILLEASDNVIERRLNDRKQLMRESISFEKYLWLKERFNSGSLCDFRFRTDLLSIDDILQTLNSVIFEGK